MQNEHMLSRYDWCGHAGAVWAAGAGSSSSETSISTHGGVEWCHALRRLQAAISLGMQLQRPARPDLKARGMGLEGYSLYHAQPRPCQPAVALIDVGRTAILCKFANKTGEGLTDITGAF